MKRRWLLLSVALALGLPSTGRSADVRLATGDKWIPFTDKDSPDGGRATSIVASVFAKMGETARIEFLPWARAYQMTLDNEVAGTFPWYGNQERRRDMLYSKPLFVTKNVVFMRKSAKIPAAWSAAPVGNLCIPVGYTLLPQVKDKLDADLLPLVRPPSMDDCLRMLRGGRVEYVITEEIVGETTAVRLKIDPKDFATIPAPLDSSPLYFLVPKTSSGAQDLIERFDKALEELRSQGAIDEIMKVNSK